MTETSWPTFIDKVQVVLKNGVQVTIVPRRMQDRNERLARTRVYGAPPALAPDETAVYDQAMSARLNAAPTLLDLKFNRDVVAARRRALAATRSRLVAALAELNFDVQVRGFSQNAGCSCGCSPGYVLDGQVKIADTPVDLHLDPPAVVS